VFYLTWPDSMKGLDTNLSLLHEDTITAKHIRVQEVSSVLLSNHISGWVKVRGGAHPPDLRPEIGSAAATPGDHHTSPRMLGH